MFFSPIIFSIFTSTLEDYILLKYADNTEINGVINCVGDRPVTYTGLSRLADLTHLKNMPIPRSCIYELRMWAMLERPKIIICKPITEKRIWTAGRAQAISALL